VDESINLIHTITSNLIQPTHVTQKIDTDFRDKKQHSQAIGRQQAHSASSPDSPKNRTYTPPTEMHAPRACQRGGGSLAWKLPSREGRVGGGLGPVREVRVRGPDGRERGGEGRCESSDGGRARGPSEISNISGEPVRGISSKSASSGRSTAFCFPSDREERAEERVDSVDWR